MRTSDEGQLEPGADGAGVELLAFADIRAMWPSESADFTPWLEENIHVLETAIGLKLSDLRREFRIGADRADLKATTSDGRTVIIECQLDTTDNSHFGQIMGYGAGVDADILVWVAPSFRDKHREAIDWINSKTGSTCEFYAVQLDIGTGCQNCTGVPRLVAVARPRFYREHIDHDDNLSYTLSQEDMTVLTLLYEGQKIEKIAKEFGWSHSKAKHRASAIYAKFGASTRAEALLVAVRVGLVG